MLCCFILYVHRMPFGAEDSIIFFLDNHLKSRGSLAAVEFYAICYPI